jgi:HlyD family secretion protein
MKKILAWCVCLLCVSLTACTEKKVIPQGRLLTVKNQTYKDTLYYSGLIKPLHTLVITSPADGAILEMPFQYGEEVSAGKLLFVLSSSKFLSDYKTALLQYIKAKSDFNTNQLLFSEAKFLHDRQLISDDEYKTKESNFYGTQLALVQAKDGLENLIHQLNLTEMDLLRLRIADIEKITQAMHLQQSSDHLKVLAPATGIILSPSKGEEENKKFNKGDLVKQGDVLALIGDMNALSVLIKVNELTINQIKVGQKVKLTGIAFSEHVLQGEITQIDKQGETQGGSPTFNVEVAVYHLTPLEKKLIHVGMSAKVEINIEDEPQILIPINAVIEKNSHSYVERYDETKHHLQEVEIKTGRTTPDTIVILAGLKEGDKIVVPN